MFTTHESSRLTQNSREGMNELYYRAKAIDELSIFVPIVFECLHVLLKQNEDGIGGATSLDLVGEWIFVEIYAGLLCVFIQGIMN